MMEYFSQYLSENASFIAVLANLATITGALFVIVSLLGVWVQQREAQKSRDIQVISEFRRDFYYHWHESWSALLASIDSKGQDHSLSAEEEKSLEPVLNWLEWVGMFCKLKALSREYILLHTLEYALRDIIRIAAPKLQKDIERYGPEYWHGVLYLCENEFDDLYQAYFKDMNKEK